MYKVVFASLAIASLVAWSSSAPAVPAPKPKPAKAASLSKAKATPTKSQAVTAKKQHRVVIQVSQNDPALMTTALNNAENLVAYYRERGEPVQVEFVAYGPGLHMLRSDTSPVKARLTQIVAAAKPITFSGCGNTLASQSKQEHHEIALAPEANVVPSGIARIADLSEQGWTYIRP
jgi:intracellular sulfur oxidation DsrE/DsrF family protein